MNKKYLLKVIILCAVLCQLFVNKASAQYAVAGTASEVMKKSVYWLTWDIGSPTNKLLNTVDFPLPPLATSTNIVNGTYTWEFSPTVHIEAQITNLTSDIGTLESYTPGKWEGDGLDVLYNGNGILADKPQNGANGQAADDINNSRGVPGSALATSSSGGATVNFDIKLFIKLLINGTWTSVPYPGMVLADAEALAYNVGATPVEYFGGTTNGATQWQLLNLAIDQRKVGGIKSQDHYVADISASGKDFKIYVDDPTGHDAGVQAVMFAKGATELTNVNMKGQGVTAIAVGFVIPFDLGDAPISYKKPTHYIEDFTPTDHLPGTNLTAFNLNNFSTGGTTNLATLTPQANVYLGSTNNVDADGDLIRNTNADGDDLVGASDENGVLGTAFTGANTIKTNQTGDVTVTVQGVTNNNGTAATLYGWIDFNRDGKFSQNEVATPINIPANSTVATPQLVFPQATFGPNIKAGLTYARFRVTTSTLLPGTVGATLEDERSITTARDGEVEDYALTIGGSSISGNVYNDFNGSTGGVTGTALNELGTGNQIYAYLVGGSNILVKKATVASGAYSFSDVDNGNYTVLLSTTNVTPDGVKTTTDLPTLIPAGWAASVEMWGVNNPAAPALTNSIESGVSPDPVVPDAKVSVSITPNNLAITDVNFGINQAPAVTNKTANTKSNVAVTVNATTGATDADGTINIATVEFANPSAPTTFITADFTVTGQGTYSLNTTTGVITFTPTATFIGAATPINFRLKDNFGTISNVGTIEITVLPNGSVDASTTGEDQPINTIVNGPSPAGNDYTVIDPTISGQSVQIAGAPTHGSVLPSANGISFDYTPASHYIGLDSYTYTITKGGQTSDPIAVNITVLPRGTVDGGTTVQNQAVNTVVNGPGPAGNDYTVIDPTISGQSVQVAGAPTHGSVLINANGISFDYTPTSGYVGTDSYTYTITKDLQTSLPITVNIAIKPVGSGDSGSTGQDQPVNTIVNGPSPGNDLTVIDPAVTGESIQISGNPTDGTVLINGDGISFDYTPTTTGFIGIDTYQYTITKNGQTSAPITVTITVKPKGSNDPVATTIGTAVAKDVIVNDLSNGATVGIAVPPNTAPVNGTIGAPVGSTITYTPTGTFVGQDTYTYTLTQNSIVSNPITVTVKVSPIGTTDNITAVMNTPISSDVIGNDTQKGTNPGGATTVTDVTQPTGHNSGAATALDLSVGNTNKIIYTPAAAGNYVGLDTYTYKLTAFGAGAVKSAAVTVNVTIKPTGQPDFSSTAIGTPVTTNVLTGAGADAPGTNPLGATTVTDVALTTPGNGGTLAIIDATVGTVKYTPAAGFIGVDTYTYKLTTADGVKSDAITVTINVKPVGAPDPATTTINTPVATTVTANDGVSGTATVTVNRGPVPAHGTLDAGTGNIITFTPATDYVGIATYTYTLTKNGVISDPITVTVNVKPTGQFDGDITTINQFVLTNVIVNDDHGLDQGSVPTAITDLTNGAHGTTVVSSPGWVKYTPAADFVGIDLYSYKIITADGVKSDLINVAINVRPTGQSDADITTIGTPVITNVVTGIGADAPGTNPGGATTVTDILTTPANGGTAVNTPGVANSITYTPAAGFVGIDTYTYKLTTADGLKSDAITVTINVKPIGVNDADLTPINTPVTTVVTANDGTSGTAPATVARVSATSVNGGLVEVVGRDIKYTPANGYVGDDTYTYTLTKGGVTSDPITVSINVYTAKMSLSKVANNGASKAGDIINYTLILKNTGTAALTNVTVTDPGADAGSITPAVTANLAAGATVSITAKHTVVAADVTLGSYSNQATVTSKDPKNITVTKVSDDPGTTTPDDPTVVPIINNGNPAIGIAKAGVFAGNKITYTFTITNTGNVNLSNITLTDTKLNLAAVTITTPVGGLVPAGTVNYTSYYTLTQADKDAGTVTNTATATGKDPNNNTVTGTGSTVTTVTKSPVAVDDHTEATTGALALVTILTNDDAKGSTFQANTIEIMSQPAHGTVAVDALGTVTYTSNTGFTGDDVFTYRVKDANGYYTNIANVTIKILPELIKIPTLFTPNGDGVNDGFVIKDLASFAQNELIVLNRWGNEVYRQPNYQNSWSGTGLNEGTYFFIVKLKKANGDSWVIQKGYVTLIRQFKK